MLTFDLASKRTGALRLLCIGAHSDDIEIGCGGTILRLLSEHVHTEVQWVVVGSSGERDQEALASAESFLADATKRDVVVRNFKTSFFPYVGEGIKTFFEELKAKSSPDIIFTHARHDLHQDHRLISKVASGPAGQVRVRLPAATDPSRLWLVASTNQGQALIALGPPAP